MVKGLSTKSCLPTFNYKLIVLFSLVFGCSFLIFIIGNDTDVLLLENTVIGEPWVLPGEHSESYTIRTEGCSIPSLDPYHESIKKFIFFPENVQNCNSQNDLPLLDINSTHIWIIDENIPFYNTFNDSEFMCCYKAFYRPNSVDDIGSLDIDKRVQYKPCVYFTSMIKVLDEFVGVTCANAQSQVYEDYFVFTLSKNLKEVNTSPTLSADVETAFSVIVMGIDAVSRMNFHRTMPRTLNFLKKLEAIELRGYNKVGDNTFPNLVPVLMGFPEEDLKETCFPKISSTFDNCPILWDWYKEAGFITAFAEDSAYLATFNFERTGFGISPTDYYLYTFMHETEQRVGHNKDLNSFLCMGRKYFYQVLLDYVLSLANTLKTSKLFGFFWEVTMSHDYLNYPMLMDKSFGHFLESMEQLGHLNRTVFVLMSDHGIRWGDIRQTKQGRIEERLPFVYLLLPPLFREQYPLAYYNAMTNSRRLTTPFDLHETLMDLKELSSVENDMIMSRSHRTYSRQRGISLFLPIPGNRTCEMAHIDDHWCTCHKSKKLSPDDARVGEAALFLIKWLNAAVQHHRQCSRLRLDGVMEASEVKMTSSALEDATHAWSDYTVVARVAPSAAVFEATLRRDAGGEWALSGSVSRLNLYGEQSACVHDYKLKLYCYCR